MKQGLFILLLMLSETAYSQIEWANYSTSLQDIQHEPSIGVAIPYNGNYDNFSRNVVGISHWNPRYKLDIDTALSAKIPLYFVYDTSGIFFMLPGINKSNTDDFEIDVLLNNRIILTHWTHVTQFTQVAVGAMAAGSGITKSYRAPIGQYLVANLRNRQGRIISSTVIYFRERAPEIISVSTSKDAKAFEEMVADKNPVMESSPDLGWHRKITGSSTMLKFAPAEKNMLIELDSKIYKREAIEYSVYKDSSELRQWRITEFNNHYILLKDLDPGNYTVSFRYRKQPATESRLQFELERPWFQTHAFRIIILAVILLAVIALLIIRNFRRQRKSMLTFKKKAEASADELQSIHALLNPHFTFNALSSIQALVNKGKQEAASQYLASFGELLRESLKQGRMAQIPMSKELENLVLYVSLEQLRYQFRYNQHVAENLDQSLLTIPPFLLQPFVENAIKHGMSKMNGEGEVNLDICSEANAMVVRISDNGPGLNAETLKEGYGLAISRKRLELLNTGYGEELIRMQLKRENSKTFVIITFENWL